MARDKAKEYDAKNYDSRERFISYHAQVSLIQELNPKTVLNIGTGNSFLKKYFSDNKIKIIEADIDKKLKPDIILDISKKQKVNKKYDIVTAFQILEHIPLNKVETALENIYNLTTKWAILSVPHRSVNFFFHIDVPFIKIPIRLEFERFFDNKPSHKTHEWEMGLKHSRKKDFEKLIEKKFKIEKQFVLEGHRYHYFFVLSKK